MALSPCSTMTDQRGRELTQHGSIWFPIACYHDDLTKAPVPWHWHTELEVLVVSEGAVEVAIGKQRLILKQGEGMFINSEVLHAAWDYKQANSRLHSAVFHPRLVGGGQDSIFWSNYLQPLLEDKGQEYICFDGGETWHAEAVQAVEAAWKNCAEEPPGYEFWVRNALSKLIFLLSRQRNRVVRPAKSLREEDRVKRMLEYIHQNCSSALTTASIAQSAVISESECLRCFRNIIGLPPIQYVMQYRIQRAAELLSSSSLGIAEIGAQCGFQDASYFAKTFHAMKGCTPSQYRKKRNSGV